MTTTTTTTNHPATDLLTCCLFGWREWPPMARFARTLREVLVRLRNDRDECETGFAEHTYLPVALALVSDPAAATGGVSTYRAADILRLLLDQDAALCREPARAEHAAADDAAWLAQQAHAQTYRARAIAAVRALALLLLMFDGRVRRLFLSTHAAGHAALGSCAMDRDRGWRFLHREHGIATACEQFVHEVQSMARLPVGLADGGIAHVAAHVEGFVAFCARMWLYGANLLPPPPPPRRAAAATTRGLFADLDDNDDPDDQ